jgi:uncharacterized protein YndB with AHSA1/START domain
MKIVLVMVGIVGGIIAIAAGVGALLPKQHTAVREASYQHSPEAIWQAITDYEKFPEWRKSVARVEALAPVNGQASWREVDTHGSVIPYAVMESKPPERLVTRIADPKLPFGGTWTFEIFPLPGGATLRITENGEVYNVIYRFMARYVFGYRVTLDAYLKSLGRKFGENVSIED